MQGSHPQGRRRLQRCPAADSDCSPTEPECARGETHQDYTDYDSAGAPRTHENAELRRVWRAVQKTRGRVLQLRTSSRCVSEHKPGRNAGGMRSTTSPVPITKVYHPSGSSTQVQEACDSSCPRGGRCERATDSDMQRVSAPSFFDRNL